MEVLLNEPHLPQVIEGLEVFKVVAAIDVDEVELAVFGRVALPGEPLVKHQVVLLRLAGELAPDDERPAAVGRGAGHGAEPVRAVRLLFEAALQPQALLAVALECGAKGPRCGNVPDREADQPVEGLQQIDVDLAALVRTLPLDLELVSRGVGEGLYVE